MSGRQAWRRTLAIRERYLAAGNPDQLPAPGCGVRREIVLSWRRSLLSGVDTAGTGLPRDEAAVPPDRLVRAARPVLARLADEIAGTRVWAFLADRECRLVSQIVGDPALRPLLADRGAVPGARFGEDVVGTNGLGTAVEQQRPFIVAGSEHFRAHESDATTAGVPVRDPITRRLVGLLNMNCRYERTSELMLPFITQLAREIEVRLLADWPAAEQSLLDEVARMWKRRSRAVVVLSEEVFVANAAALGLVGGADQEVLRELARDAAALGRERTVRVTLGTGQPVRARCRPLSVPSRHLAAVVTLQPAAGPARGAAGSARAPSPALPARRPAAPGDRLLGEVDLARRTRLPVLVRGERGTGKTTLARRLHDPSAGPGLLTVADCALSGLRPAAWTQHLAAALADPSATVVLQHLQALDPAVLPQVAGLVAAARARVAATMAGVAATTDGTGEAAARAALAERFGAIVDVPPLRERAAEIPALVTEIIARLRPEPPRPRCAPEALAALAGGEWPGNIRQLRQVVATALTRSMSCDITVDDLPAGYQGTARDRHLTGLERAERQALIAALRTAGGDREAAARELGISRATIYRKLRRLGITAPAAPGSRG